jgi:hypothetical protein
MNPIEFTPELLVGIVGTVLSLIFSYFPVVHDWYQALKTEAKSGIMLGLLVISSLVVVALVYYGVFPVSEPITWQLWLRVLFAAIVMNQATYLISPQKKQQ